jgi:hypothetical protein
MKYLMAVLLCGLVISCKSRSVVPDHPYCKSVKGIDNWSFTDTPPHELRNYEKIARKGNVVYWFRNRKNEYLMCTRPKEHSVCGEEAREFQFKDGKWEQKIGLTITVCH